MSFIPFITRQKAVLEKRSKCAPKPKKLNITLPETAKEA